MVVLFARVSTVSLTVTRVVACSKPEAAGEEGTPMHYTVRGCSCFSEGNAVRECEEP